MMSDPFVSPNVDPDGPMPNFNALFKAEVARLARKEIRAEVGPTRKAVAQMRHDVAALKRQVAALEKQVAFLEKQEGRRIAKAPSAKPPKGTRFSPGWVKSDRKRLGLSAKDYGRLVGVSGLTIYNWESGKSKPREKQLAAWAAIRGLGKREAQRRLAVLDA